MIDWIFGHLGVVVFLVIFISQILRAVARSRKTAATHEAQRNPSAEAQRAKEIQEQIRRQIMERRAGRGMPSRPAVSPSEPTARPAPRPETTQLPELFGGPLGRMIEELQRRAQPPPTPAAPPPITANSREAAELQRQQQLADELRALQETRTITQRRAAHVAADKRAEAESEPALREVARDRLLADLGDPQSLRRAFVLREVLGTPVGLR